MNTEIIIFMIMYPGIVTEKFLPSCYRTQYERKTLPEKTYKTRD